MSTPRKPQSPDQYCLFSLGLNLAELRAEKEAFVRKAKSPNTLKAYEHCWRVFTGWCSMAGKQALPADSDTIEMFLTWGANHRRYRVETMKLQCSAIRDKHEEAGFPSPVDAEVRTLLSGIVRDTKEEEGGKDAVEVDHLRRICRRLSDGQPLTLRNRALILVGFASAWRRSELSALQIKDLNFENRGARLFIPHSKGDQEGKGDVTEIVYAQDRAICPVRALKAWLAVRGNQPGPVFVRFQPWGDMTYETICGQTVADVVKGALALIGEDPKRFAAHSMRAGMMTAAARKNVPLHAIKAHARHKRIETTIRYVRRDLPFRANALEKVL